LKLATLCKFDFQKSFMIAPALFQTSVTFRTRDSDLDAIGHENATRLIPRLRA
jgi:hypothetical protein